MQVFISYKREDEAFARDLCQQIQAWGYVPWLDVEHIQPGEKWDAAIDTALKESEIVLGIMTPESLGSDNVLDEWSYALEASKRLVLLWLRDVSPAEISYRFIRPQRIDFRTDTAAGMAQLRALLDSPAKIIPPGSTAPVSIEPALQTHQATSNRARMLHKVHDFWIRGVLENALHESGAFDLGLETAPESVLRHADFGDYILPASTRIADLFCDLDREILILGAPGSGKTIMLLQLANALIREAQANEVAPLPVVFNLSSWAAERRPFDEWLREELQNKYQVPKKLAAQWVAHEQLLLLLDGLDEVAAAYRDLCVEAINDFRNTYRIVDMAVCSRTADYEALSTKLDIQEAIVLQPLGQKTIDSYLSQEGLAGLREMMAADATLREMAAVPFLLNTMAFAYRDSNAISLRVRDSARDRRTHLFDHYVEKRLRHIAADAVAYTPREVRLYLAALAAWMLKNQQTVFFIEGLQPDWLHDIGQYWKYRLLTKLAIGLSYGLAFGVTYGIVVGLILGALPGVLIGVLLAVIFSLSAMPTMDPEKIELDETLRLQWNRRDLATGAVTAALVAGMTLVVGRLLHILEPAMTVSAVAGTVGFLSAGISSAENLELRSVPNQGIRRCIQNAVRIGGLVTLAAGLTSFLMSAVLVNPATGIAVGIIAGLGFGLFLGLVFGIRAVIKHVALRFILRRSNQIPHNYAHFLDYAANDLRIMRKVGGGYIFIHRYLLEYFAGSAPH